MKTRFAAATLLMFSFAATTNADWFEDFNDGQLPAGWEFLTHPAFPSDTFSVDASAGYLELSEARSINDGGTNVLRAVNTTEQFSDVRVSADVNIDSSLGTFMGLSVDGLSDGLSGAYLFGIEMAPSADEGTAWLARADAGGIVQWGSKRDFGINTTLDITSSYFLVLDVVGGNQLTGRVFDMVGGTELIRITQTVPNPLDGPYYAGVYSDLAAGFEHIATAGTFDNVSAVTIPEPSGDFLVVFGVLALACSARRRRSH